MKNYSVYLLRCHDGSLYCGITTDVERRVRQHNQGIGSKYTRGRRPVSLLVSAENLTHSEALKIEYQVKKLRDPILKVEFLGRAFARACRERMKQNAQPVQN